MPVPELLQGISLGLWTQIHFPFYIFMYLFCLGAGCAVFRAQDNLLRLALLFHHVPSRIKLRPSGVVASKCAPQAGSFTLPV